MSKCISVHGEYSEHEYTSKPICDYCGQISEMIALAQLQVMRTALEQIQELHKPFPVYTRESGECYHGDECEGVELENGTYCPDYTEGFTCIECAELAKFADDLPEWPCPTRKLADAGLTDRMARTNQGDK